MQAISRKLKNLCETIAIAGGLAAILQACVSTQSVPQQPTASQPQAMQAQPVKVDGSSTVYPITQTIVKQFNAQSQETVKVVAEFSGTGGGFRKFCAGETDINNASRPIQMDEMEACRQANIAYIELPVAFDALTVVVHPQNDWAKDLTVAELKKIWEPDAQKKITNWNQVRPSFPDRPLVLYGAGIDSGTYDYFTEAIVGKSGASRSDYTASEDDDLLVKGVSNDPNALGYFGLAYYEANQDKLKAIAIDNGSGAVLPSRETVEKAQYKPLARPLFIYVNSTSAKENSLLVNFVDFYLKEAPKVVASVGYIPLPSEGYHIGKVTFHQGEVGTVFEGKSEFNLTIGELLRKKAKF